MLPRSLISFAFFDFLKIYFPFFIFIIYCIEDESIFMSKLIFCIVYLSLGILNFLQKYAQY